MNQTVKFNELKNRFYIFYYANEKPCLLKKESESQMLSSINRLKNKGIDAVFGIDLETFDVTAYNYKELSNKEEIGNPCTLIVKDNRLSQYYIMTVGDKFGYDLPVYLSCGDYIMVNRREKSYELVKR